MNLIEKINQYYYLIKQAGLPEVDQKLVNSAAAFILKKTAEKIIDLIREKSEDIALEDTKKFYKMLLVDWHRFLKPKYDVYPIYMSNESCVFKEYEKNITFTLVSDVDEQKFISKEIGSDLDRWHGMFHVMDENNVEIFVFYPAKIGWSDKAKNLITDTVRHELQHAKQYLQDKYVYTGLSPKKTRSLKHDIFGTPKNISQDHLNDLANNLKEVVKLNQEFKDKNLLLDLVDYTIKSYDIEKYDLIIDNEKQIKKFDSKSLGILKSIQKYFYNLAGANYERYMSESEKFKEICLHNILQQEHHLMDIEFYTDLNDQIDEFKRAIKLFPKKLHNLIIRYVILLSSKEEILPTLKEEIEKIISDHEDNETLALEQVNKLLAELYSIKEYFNVLHSGNPAKYKKAVNEFVKATSLS